jgi:multisubunit Na+/H+ antiporter MnhG subunit
MSYGLGLVLAFFLIMYILAKVAKKLFKLVLFVLLLAALSIHFSGCASSKCRWSAQKKQRYLIDHSRF